MCVTRRFDRCLLFRANKNIDFCCGGLSKKCFVLLSRSVKSCLCTRLYTPSNARIVRLDPRLFTMIYWVELHFNLICFPALSSRHIYRTPEYVCPDCGQPADLSYSHLIKILKVRCPAPVSQQARGSFARVLLAHHPPNGFMRHEIVMKILLPLKDYQPAVSVFRISSLFTVQCSFCMSTST